MSDKSGVAASQAMTKHVSMMINGAGEKGEVSFGKPIGRIISLKFSLLHRHIFLLSVLLYIYFLKLKENPTSALPRTMNWHRRRRFRGNLPPPIFREGLTETLAN